MCALQKVISVLGVDVGYFHAHIKGVDFVFVDHPSYQRVGGLYADAFGVYGDNQASAVLQTNGAALPCFCSCVVGCSEVAVPFSV